MIIDRVLVALDGSDHAAKALDLACEVASRFGAELIAMHAMPDKPLSEAERRMAEVEFQPEVARHFDVTPSMDARGDIRLMSQRLTEQAAETGRRFRLALGTAGGGCQGACPPKSRGERAHAVARGRPGEGDPGSRNEEQVDIIVLGRRGLGDLAGLLLGSVSHKVTHLAECACLTVK